MNLPIRSILAISILAIVLAACSTTSGAPTSPSQTPSQPAAPSEEPSEQPSEQPSEEPSDEERDVDGTITVAEGMVPSGPGATIQEALDNGPSGEFPTLVNGVLFLDPDGRIYLATAVSDPAAPTFDGPMLEVIGLDADGPELDMDNAEVLGLEEANGIVFNPEAQVLGFLEID